jgi:hypothetical protein
MLQRMPQPVTAVPAWCMAGRQVDGYVGTAGAAICPWFAQAAVVGHAILSCRGIVLPVCSGQCLQRALPAWSLCDSMGTAAGDSRLSPSCRLRATQLPTGGMCVGRPRQVANTHSC